LHCRGGDHIATINAKATAAAELAGALQLQPTRPRHGCSPRGEGEVGEAYALRS